MGHTRFGRDHERQNPDGTNARADEESPNERTQIRVRTLANLGIGSLCPSITSTP